MRIHAAAIAATLAAVAVLSAGCSTGQPATTTTAAASATAEPSTVTVFAAASMKATFTELGEMFEADHPGVTVTFSFAGSQDLAAQLTGGASADVFAAANEATMKTVTDAGLAAGDPTIYATNQLTIVVPPDNPAGIASFADLAQEGLALVVCAPAVPCGAATEKVEAATGIALSPVSEEQAVTDVLAKVQAGEADAGLVYQTDAITAGDSVMAIPFDESSSAINRNPIVSLTDGPEAALGGEFVDLVLGAEGQEVLAAAGFGAAA